MRRQYHRWSQPQQARQLTHLLQPQAVSPGRDSEQLTRTKTTAKAKAKALQLSQLQRALQQWQQNLAACHHRQAKELPQQQLNSNLSACYHYRHRHRRCRHSQRLHRQSWQATEKQKSRLQQQQQKQKYPQRLRRWNSKQQRQWQLRPLQQLPLLPLLPSSQRRLTTQRGSRQRPLFSPPRTRQQQSQQREP